MNSILYPSIIFNSIKIWAKNIKRDVVTVYVAAHNPQTPIFIRVFALLIAGYALSPIDLIPDFIPILGYLDDVLIVPFGIWMIIKLLPQDILITSRKKAEEILVKPRSRIAAGVIVVIWIFMITALLIWILF